MKGGLIAGSCKQSTARNTAASLSAVAFHAFHHIKLHNSRYAVKKNIRKIVRNKIVNISMHANVPALLYSFIIHKVQ